MSWIIQHLVLVPDVIWSAVIASGLTLGGVLLSNRSHAKNLRMQLEHDATEKTKERTLALRREVYLEAVEELSHASSRLASLPKADLTKPDGANVLQSFVASAAKLQLVAEPGTVALVNQLVADYNELVLKLLVRLIPVQKARANIETNERLYNDAQGQVSRVLAEMNRMNESAERKPEVFDALRRSLESYQAQASKSATRTQTAWEEFQRLEIDFGRKLISELRPLTERHVPVLIAVRRDLGLVGNLDELAEQMRSQATQLQERLEEIFAMVRDETSDTRRAAVSQHVETR